jgi:hypothetical protein
MKFRDRAARHRHCCRHLIVGCTGIRARRLRLQLPLGRTGGSSPATDDGTESLRIPNRHDTGSTSPRSVGEVALISDTVSHYSPVLIAPLAINFIAPAHPEKKSARLLRPFCRVAVQTPDRCLASPPRPARPISRDQRRGSDTAPPVLDQESIRAPGWASTRKSAESS